MAPITRRAATKEAGKEPTKPMLKIKLSAKQVQTAIQLAAVQKQEAAIEKAAAIEADLRRAKEAELRTALQVARPTALRRASVADTPSGPITSNTAEEPTTHSDDEGEEGSDPREGTPLFLNDEVEDELSPVMQEQDDWVDEPEWSGFGDDRMSPALEGDGDEVDVPPQSTTKLANEAKLKPKPKPKKPLLIRDLVKTQIRKDNMSVTLELKKRKLTAEDANRPPAKRVVSRSLKTDAKDNTLTIRPGFLEDDDDDTIQGERNAANAKGKNASKSVIKITHEKTPSNAGEKRKKSNVATCYLPEFDTRFAPELIKRVSEDHNPWHPTFDTGLEIAKIRRRVFPNITESFEGRDPLASPALTKVTNWRAAIGRRAMALVKAYFSDETSFETKSDIEDHVNWLLPSQDTDQSDETDMAEVEEEADIEDVVRRRKSKFVGALFLWENGLIGAACEELPSGYLLSPLILETFAIHFETTGINMDPIEYKQTPVGALALVLSAVERAIRCWTTGREDAPKPFSQFECGSDTKDYVDALIKIPQAHWQRVFASTRQYTSYRQRDIPEQSQKKPSVRAQVPAGL